MGDGNSLHRVRGILPDFSEGNLGAGGDGRAPRWFDSYRSTAAG